jgi:molybdopterin molybdotransferase
MSGAAIPFEAAVRAVVAACDALDCERVALAAASARVLAQDLVAADDLVPFARSAMDGYALRSEETRAAPRRFPLAAGAFAERATRREHEAGTATAVATGAPIPLGADAVVPFEDVLASDGAIVVTGPLVRGAHIFAPGEDARRGDLLARAGDVLGPASLGLLAAAGHAELDVIRRPRVTVVTSGDEIVPIDAVPGFGEIRNSNAVSIAATLVQLGAEVVRREHVRDDGGAMRDVLARACARSDLVVTTGGASVGERDFVKPALDLLGADFAFRSVAMRPARPTGFARLGDARIATLSGNPAAATVALHELVRPALFALAGRRDGRLPRIRARLRGELHGRGDRTYFAFAAISISETGTFEARPLANQCSALTRNARDAGGFAVVEPHRGDIGEGEPVDVDVFDWSGVGAAVPAVR